jgi:hypothetical protein
VVWYQQENYQMFSSWMVLLWCCCWYSCRHIH